MENATAMTDPVCGMSVESATAAGHAEYKGQTYYFCCAGCRAKFDAKPEQYAGKSPTSAKGGHGCCS